MFHYNQLSSAKIQRFKYISKSFEFFSEDNASETRTRFFNKEVFLEKDRILEICKHDPKNLKINNIFEICV